MNSDCELRAFLIHYPVKVSTSPPTIVQDLAQNGHQRRLWYLSEAGYPPTNLVRGKLSRTNSPSLHVAHPNHSDDISEPITSIEHIPRQHAQK